MTPFWVTLLRDFKHIAAILFWKKIIEITTLWERETNKHIHKGSLYAYLAYTYLMTGQYDTGFSFIYNAIEDDIELNKECPTLNYPKEAPVYLTASLSSKPANMMGNLVGGIRSELENFLSGYRIEFGSSLSMNDLDSKFLQNPALETIKYFFVFTLWVIINYKRNIESRLMNNDFSKLKNATWFFTLCIVIDELLGNKEVFKVKFFGNRIIKYITFKKLMSQADVEGLLKSQNISKGDPDEIIPNLLSLKLRYNNKIVPKEIQHLFVSWNLRNFAGHEIKTKKVFVEQFDKILEFLLFDIFLIIEEY